MLCGIYNCMGTLMDNAFKTREQPNEELASLRQKVAELMKLEEVHRKAEEALKRSEEKYIALFENLNDAAFVADTESGVIIETNKKGELLLSRTQKEIIGMHQTEIHPPAKSEEYRKRFAVHIQKGHVVDYDGEVIRKDGSIVQVSISAAPLIIGGKKLIIGFFRDIEKLKHTQTALYESEKKYRSLVKNVRLGIFRSTPGKNGRFLEVNPAMEKITGYTRDELLRMNVSDLYVYPEEREYVLEKATQAMGKVNKELKVKKNDGTPIIVSDTKTPVRNNKGELLYFDGILEDITERKKMEEQLVITDRLASIGELASGVAHELNNPLTGVIGFSKLLLDKKINNDTREDVAIIHHEAVRAAEVVKNLLTFARKHKPSKQPIRINSIIASVLGMRSYEHKVNNIKTITRFSSDLPGIVADSFQIEQVFVNIIINAEYAMEKANKGGVLIATTEKKEDYVQITLTDDGIGISEKDLGHIFDPFFTTKEVGEGTGLGLSICHGIIDKHGGRIFAQSEPGKGATFIIELPINRSNEGENIE